MFAQSSPGLFELPEHDPTALWLPMECESPVHLSSKKEVAVVDRVLEKIVYSCC